MARLARVRPHACEGLVLPTWAQQDSNTPRTRLIALGRLTGLIITIIMICSVHGRECAVVGQSLAITTTATVSEGGEEGDQEGEHRVS